MHLYAAFADSTVCMLNVSLLCCSEDVALAVLLVMPCCGVVCCADVRLQALRCALDLEPRLMGPIRTAVTSSCRFKCTVRLFGTCLVVISGTAAPACTGGCQLLGTEYDGTHKQRPVYKQPAGRYLFVVSFDSFWSSPGRKATTSSLAGSPTAFSRPRTHCSRHVCCAQLLHGHL
jgi:hypothetical protein